MKLKTKTQAITMSALLSRRKKKTKTQDASNVPKVIDESDSYEEIGSPISAVMPVSLESSHQSITSTNELTLIHNNSNDSIDNVNETEKEQGQYISSSLARANYVR